MSELELALIDLGRRLDFPETPDVAPRVRARLAEGAAGRGMPGPYSWRRLSVIALAVLAVAIAAVMAVPQTRAAILEFFHLRGVTIERVGELPTVPVRNELGPLGKRVSLDEARKLADFDVVVPEALGEPDEVYFRSGSPAGGMVSFVYGTTEHPRALFTEFEANVNEVIFKKVAPETTIERVLVEGGPGYWIGGAHFFSYVDRNGVFQQEAIRLAGNTLLWERGPVTLRLEADVSKAEALRIGLSVKGD
jgi:hypothetical protein